MNWYMDSLVITDATNIKPYGEHNGKEYLVYFENIPKEQMYFKFSTKWRLEEFLYLHKIEKFAYKSSNGKVITKVWEYIPENIEHWKSYDWGKTKKEKEEGMPEKYSWDDWRCGHYIKEK